MKKFITFNYEPLKPAIVIDGFNPIFADMPFTDVLPTTGVAHEHILIKNFSVLPEKLLFCLGSQYIRGAQIEFDLPKRNFHKTYALAAPYRTVRFKWVDLDYTKLPKRLASHTYTYTDSTGARVKTTCLAEFQKLTTTRMPKHLWDAIDEYSNKRLENFKKYCASGPHYYSKAEDWFRTLTKDAMKCDLYVESPNPKSYYEAKAELRFEQDCAAMRLQDGLRPLNNEELLFLHKYAAPYGIEIPKQYWRINTREIKKEDLNGNLKSWGYTVEPEIVTGGIFDDTRKNYDRDAKRRPNLPKEMRNGLQVKSADNDKLLREAYMSLIWVMKHLKDEGLVPGYRRCPVCHEIYREHEGCECGACTGVELIPADNLFYGIASTYEDWESTDEYIDNLESLY